MKIKYDPRSDIIYLEFKNTTVTTKRITDDIAIDYDADGKVAGLEILEASKNVFAKKKDFSVKVEGGLTPVTA